MSIPGDLLRSETGEGTQGVFVTPSMAKALADAAEARRPGETIMAALGVTVVENASLPPDVAVLYNSTHQVVWNTRTGEAVLCKRMRIDLVPELVFRPGDTDNPDGQA